MQIGALTTGSIATATWINATRTLTNDPSALLNEEGAFVSVAAPANQGVLGTYVQIVASCAHTVRAVELSSAGGTTHNHRFVISTGSGGSEVVKKTFRVVLGSTSAPFTFKVDLDPTIIPKGTRVAVAVSNESSASADSFAAGVTLIEAND